jgi:NADP-dependent alcohol dehydrogenase
MSQLLQGQKQKDKLFFASPYVMPQFSVLEPELTFTLPQHQTANGVVDACACP